MQMQLPLRGEKDDVFGISLATTTDAQLSFVTEGVKIQKAVSLCAGLDAVVGEPGAQYRTVKNNIPVRRAIMDGSL